MSHFNYAYEPDTSEFKFYVHDLLIYSFNDCEPMTEKEAYNMAEDLYTEYHSHK